MEKQNGTRTGTDANENGTRTGTGANENGTRTGRTRTGSDQNA